MAFDLNTLVPLLPEILVLCLVCVVLVVDLFLDDEYRIVSYGIAQGGLILAILVTMLVGKGPEQVLFDGNYRLDLMATVLKAAMMVLMLFAFVYAKDYLRNHGLFKAEYYELGLFALLGMMIMVSAGGFLALYLGLELLALSLYALVAFDRDSKPGSEAAMKYFVLGALASGMLLYGISMIYGATGHIDFPGIAARLCAGDFDATVLVFGLVFLVIGIGFKTGLVPFHMWAPDVYEGAPTAVTMLLGSVPKLAAFAIAMRILVDGLLPLHAHWQGMLIVLTVLSMALGNLVAIAQTNIKRMLAYSTISHVGFLMLGILAGTREGYAASLFYAVVYALMALGAFGVLILLGRKGFDVERLDDLKGLNQRSPWFAGMMLLLMFSMAGVPPTVGFFAKLFVLESVVDVGLVWLAVYGVFFSIVGAFYYLRIVKLMYFDAPEDETPLEAGIDTRFMLSVNALAVLWFGLFPSSLMSLCDTAFAAARPAVAACGEPPAAEPPRRVGDVDGDGVPDRVDACPATPAGLHVDASGCAPDRDGDGVADQVDMCPATQAGAEVDRTGCAPRSAIVLEGVTFLSGSVSLTDQAKQVLDVVAASMLRIEGQRYEVAGHTDTSGSAELNQRLSQQRAEAVRGYLIEKGVSEMLLIARGYGGSRPIASNATPEGRRKNRRVEINRLPSR